MIVQQFHLAAAACYVTMETTARETIQALILQEFSELHTSPPEHMSEEDTASAPSRIIWYKNMDVYNTN